MASTSFLSPMALFLSSAWRSFHPWVVVQAGGCNSRHDNPCIVCMDSLEWQGWLLVAKILNMRHYQSCPKSCERAIVCIVVMALHSLVVFLLDLNSLLLYHVCYLLEVVGDGVGSCLHQALARSVAIGYANGGASCVATHEDVEMGVAHHHGIGGLQGEVGERLADGPAWGLASVTSSAPTT